MPHAFVGYSNEICAELILQVTNVQGLGMRLEGDFQSSEPTMAKPKRCVVMTETLMLSSEH